MAMEALPQILLSPIVLIISLDICLIPLWTFAAFTGFTAIATTFATRLCKVQSFWSEPILSLHCRFHFDKLGGNLIGGGSHRHIFVPYDLKEDIPLVVPWDSMKEVDTVLLPTHDGDCLCICVIVSLGRISASGQRPCAEIAILECPIDLRYIVVDMSAVLLLDAPKAFANLDDIQLQL